jgi:hypothetical protein
MTAIEKNLLDTLIELEQTISTMSQANPKPNLLPLFARLEEMTQQLPKGSDPSLLHYLHKKSYQKARLFLEGKEGENERGNCDRS